MWYFVVGEKSLDNEIILIFVVSYYTRLEVIGNWNVTWRNEQLVSSNCKMRVPWGKKLTEYFQTLTFILRDQTLLIFASRRDFHYISGYALSHESWILTQKDWWSYAGHRDTLCVKHIMANITEYVPLQKGKTGFLQSVKFVKAIETITGHTLCKVICYLKYFLRM